MGTIVGLANKAIRWHQRQLALERATTVRRYGAHRHVGTPPIPLPSDSAIRHLGTVEDIVDEGQRMGHCVASYVPEAIAGRCYLFHVEHEGDAATVMVQWDGAITEAAGPRNRRNEAYRGEWASSASGPAGFNWLKPGGLDEGVRNKFGARGHRRNREGFLQERLISMHEEDEVAATWEDRYWTFVAEHTRCDGAPVIKDELVEETEEGFSFIALSARCPGCGRTWSETVEAEALAYVDLDGLRLAVTDPREWERRAVERLWKGEEALKPYLPSKSDSPH